MNGADYIAQFLADRGIEQIFVVNGGAAAFLIDAVARHPQLDYRCFVHEQSTAMAADSVWRLTGHPGATIATSGPGATNLLTGIACSYFDSIPAIHITGQVNMRESAAYMGAQVRQCGFQETNIVAMAAPVCKYAVQVRSVDELRRELSKAYNIATTGRMGPVLIDVPMNVQQDEMGDEVVYDPIIGTDFMPIPEAAALANRLNDFFAGAERPLVLLGAGAGLSGAADAILTWVERSGVPFVASWSALTFFDHGHPGYCGPIGVYGNRGANSILQNCDRLLVLGSRLDNRQRSGNPKAFAPGARVHVIDLDGEELKKYGPDGYEVTHIDLRNLPPSLDQVAPSSSQPWRSYVATMREDFLGRDISTFANRNGTLSPYLVMSRLNGIMDTDAVVIADTGATLCWLYQTFQRSHQALHTAAGNSPMGYALPAAIGAAFAVPGRQIVSINGDGGFQLNLQELQTIRHYNLNIAVVVVNNAGYGIIKQFQDSYLNSRYEASGRGYSVPELADIAHAYGLDYRRVESADDLTGDVLRSDRAVLVEVRLAPNTLIEPKLEMGRPINDQFPYMTDEEFAKANPFVSFPRSPI
ncbi:thiamine pyrophosphate-binding protein [Azospirillum sp.]|uniref:thiamine pyrophosphate-binding protein n=1 Tax=Azospirillum sp. TaxID=34012 RepID=UPI00262595BA|nr:thiamine pyrophosphate-binding protein [Azospirillum sp.]